MNESFINLHNMTLNDLPDIVDPSILTKEMLRDFLHQHCVYFNHLYLKVAIILLIASFIIMFRYRIINYIESKKDKFPIIKELDILDLIIYFAQLTVFITSMVMFYMWWVAR